MSKLFINCISCSQLDENKEEWLWIRYAFKPAVLFAWMILTIIRWGSLLHLHMHHCCRGYWKQPFISATYDNYWVPVSTFNPTTDKAVWRLEFFHICKQSVDCLLQLTFYLLNLDIFQAARGKSYHYISSYHHTFHSTSVSSLDSCKHCIWHYCDKTPIAFMGDILAEKDA